VLQKETQLALQVLALWQKKELCGRKNRATHIKTQA
jgi:hypothetical protein